MPRRDSRPDSGAPTPALAALTAAGVRFQRHAYVHDPRSASYGLEAAEALGVEPARVLKTLVVTDGARHCVALVPVDRSLDLKAAARALGLKRLVMAEPARAERLTGYVVGAISPFGQRTALPTVVAESALAHRTVLVSAGRRGLEVELAPSDLLTVTAGASAAIAR